MKTPTQDSEPLLLHLQDGGSASKNSRGLVLDLFYIASASLLLVALLAFVIMELMAMTVSIMVFVVIMSLVVLFFCGNIIFSCDGFAT